MKTSKAINPFWTFLLLLLAVVLPVSKAQATKAGAIPITTCEYVVSTTGNFYLPADLICSSATFGVGITASSVDLDLNGHGIFNFNSSSNLAGTGTGIGTGTAPFSGDSCVAASNVHIHGGTVAGWGFGIAICSPPGKSVGMSALVEHMAAVSNYNGVEIYGPTSKNQIENSNISNNQLGVALFGDAFSNDIGGNVLNHNSSPGIEVFANSSGNNIHNNSVINDTAGNPGIAIAGNQNTITGNSVASNVGHGIELYSLSSGNTISGNIAVYNDSLDAVDDNGFCGANTWQNNYFGTASPACIQ